MTVSELAQEAAPSRAKLTTTPEGSATYEKLVWLYGAERAEAIMRGRDGATNADIAKWRGLGK